MTTDPFAPAIVQRAVNIQAYATKCSEAEQFSRELKEKSEQEFREVLDEIATLHPALLSDDSVGPWLSYHLINTLHWTVSEVEELREVASYMGAV